MRLRIFKIALVGLIICSCSSADDSQYQAWNNTSPSGNQETISPISSDEELTTEGLTQTCDAVRQIVINQLDFDGWESGNVDDFSFGDSLVAASSSVILMSTQQQGTELSQSLFELGSALANLGDAIRDQQSEEVVVGFAGVVAQKATAFNDTCESIRNATISTEGSSTPALVPPSPGEMTYEEAATALRNLANPGLCLGENFNNAVITYLAIESSNLNDDSNYVSQFYTTVVIPAAREYSAWMEGFVGDLNQYSWPGKAAIESLGARDPLPENSPGHILATIRGLQFVFIGEDWSEPGTVSVLGKFSKSQLTFDEARSTLLRIWDAFGYGMVYLPELLNMSPEELMPSHVVDAWFPYQPPKEFLRLLEQQVRNQLDANSGVTESLSC